jgi:hypothetical protein
LGTNYAQALFLGGHFAEVRSHIQDFIFFDDGAAINGNTKLFPS